jgi:hypothetical protein
MRDGRKHLTKAGNAGTGEVLPRYEDHRRIRMVFAARTPTRDFRLRSSNSASACGSKEGAARDYSYGPTEVGPRYEPRSGGSWRSFWRNTAGKCRSVRLASELITRYSRYSSTSVGISSTPFIAFCVLRSGLEQRAHFGRKHANRGCGGHPRDGLRQQGRRCARLSLRPD